MQEGLNGASPNDDLGKTVVSLEQQFDDFHEMEVFVKMTNALSRMIQINLVMVEFFFFFHNVSSSIS